MISSAIALVGASHTPPRANVQDRSYEEMIFEATTAALADAGLTAADIDSVVLSTSDQVHGRVIESMVTNGAAGGVGKDVTTVASGGDHAFIYACLRLKAGQARRVLVAVASKESEGRNPLHADWLSAEPFLMRPLGVSSVAAAGLQASAYAAQFGLDAERVAEVGSRRRAAWARGNDPIEVDDPSRLAAWPLTRGDLPAPCDVASAAVLVAGDAVLSEQIPAWIDGVGWVEDRYQLGERDLTRFASLEAAALMALGEGRTARDVDVVEVQEISTVASFAALESLGLAARGKGASRAEDDFPTVNPSGGNLPGNPGNAAGFLRLLAAAQQVRGRAGADQVTPRPGRAIGAAMHGFAGQGASVVVFTATRDAGAA